MLQSELFTKTRKESPSDEVAKNAQLLIRAGFVNKEMAGVYSYLPLGLRVLKKIESVIRAEMEHLGGQELLLSALHPEENWRKTGRWESMDVLFKLVDSFDKQFALAPTHEEVVVPMAKQFASSYRDLPFSVFQFQTKFRMEKRAKSGILRGREFIMNDMYSFHTNEEDMDAYYDRVTDGYTNIFRAVGIGEKTHLTYASGGTFSKYSHEFQTVTPAGEDLIHICGKCGTGVNDEIRGEQKDCPSCGGGELTEAKAIEVGNIFKLKTKFSDAFGLTYKDETGSEQPVLMGCYGIGLNRVMGTVVEVLSDEQGIVWPESIAPFQVHLVALPGGAAYAEADELYKALSHRGVEVLFDDREAQAGEKFSDADLIGIPWRVVVSEKTVEKRAVEVKRRTERKATLSSKEELFHTLSLR